MKEAKRLEIDQAVRTACLDLNAGSDIGLFVTAVDPVMKHYGLRLKGAAHAKGFSKGKPANLVRIVYTKGMMELKTEIPYLVTPDPEAEKLRQAAGYWITQDRDNNPSKLNAGHQTWDPYLVEYHTGVHGILCWVNQAWMHPDGRTARGQVKRFARIYP